MELLLYPGSVQMIKWGFFFFTTLIKGKIKGLRWETEKEGKLGRTAVVEIFAMHK